MKKFLCTFFLCLLSAVTLGVSARAAEDILKVGLRYGGTALSSASLESVQGGGFSLGWFDEETRAFHKMERVEEELGFATTVVATGGMAQFIAPLCRREIKLEKDLLLKGLNIIYQKNKK